MSDAVTGLAGLWMHDVVVEEIVPIPKGQRLPRCTAGARACPPEDCGGTPGYYDLLESLRDPDDPKHETSRIWVGGRYDPEAFDLRGPTGAGCSRPSPWGSRCS